jgi:hypothetical protein
VANTSLICIFTSYAFTFSTSSTVQLVFLMKVDTVLCKVGTAVLGTLIINNSYIFLADKLFLFTPALSFPTIIFSGFIFSPIYEAVNFEDLTEYIFTVL